jgi:hypothetical protein
MQGFERAARQLLDAAALAGHLVPEGSMFAFLAAHRAEVFPDADYADLFSPPGVRRPSLPATQNNSCRGGRSTLGQHGQNGISRHTPARLLKRSCEP